MPTLSEKLKALGVQIGARDLKPRRRQHPIEQVVPGSFQETPHGDVYLAQERYPVDTKHGCASLRLGPLPRILAEWAQAPCIAEVPPKGIAFLDTETTGLGRGASTYAFMVGVGRTDGETFQLVQFFMRDPAQEQALLSALTAFLQPCQVLVTFNGRGFDVPLLNTRYVINREPSPLPDLAHLDLLPLARRLWHDRLPSRALGALERQILDISRTHEDVPGRKSPGMYFDYVRSGDARPLKSVFYHNAIDVLSMVALLNHVSGQLDNPLSDPPGGPALPGLDVVDMGKLFEALGHKETAVRLYRRALKRKLPKEIYWKTVQRLSFIHKREGSMSTAIDLWREAAGSGQIYAHVELAKYEEHKAHDYVQAAQWTQRAIDLVQSPDYSRHKRLRWLPELEHRLARLHRKMEKNQAASQKTG